MVNFASLVAEKCGGRQLAVNADSPLRRHFTGESAFPRADSHLFTTHIRRRRKDRNSDVERREGQTQ